MINLAFKRFFYSPIFRLSVACSNDKPPTKIGVINQQQTSPPVDKYGVEKIQGVVESNSNKNKIRKRSSKNIKSQMYQNLKREFESLKKETNLRNQNLKNKIKQKSSKSYIINKWTFLIGLLAFIYGMYYNNSYIQQNTKNLNNSSQNLNLQKENDPEAVEKQKQKAILKKYGQKQLKNVQYYLEGTYAQTQIQRIFEEIEEKKKLKEFEQQSYVYPITLILGNQGIGKSQAIFSKISKLRKSGNSVYYFTFSRKQRIQNGSSKLSITELQQLQKLLIAVHSSMQKGESKYIIIDDVNRLQKVDYMKIHSLFGLVMGNYRAGVKVIMVSGSSRFYPQIWKNHEISKIWHNLIKIITTPKMYDDQLFLKLATQFKNISPEICKIVKQKGYTLRKSNQLFQKINNLTDEEKLNEIQKYDDLQYNMVKNGLDNVLFKQKSQKYSRQVMRNIIIECINNERIEKIDDAERNCRKIIKINDKTYYKIQGLTYQMIDQLDIKNTIMFCTPRTEAYRRYFQRYLKEMEQKKYEVDQNENKDKNNV